MAPRSRASGGGAVRQSYVAAVVVLSKEEIVGLKLGRRLASKRCKWCRTWEVYECGYPHRGMFGPLRCSQCDGAGALCAAAGHRRRRSDW